MATLVGKVVCPPVWKAVLRTCVTLWPQDVHNALNEIAGPALGVAGNRKAVKRGDVDGAIGEGSHLGLSDKAGDENETDAATEQHCSNLSLMLVSCKHGALAPSQKTKTSTDLYRSPECMIEPHVEVQAGHTGVAVLQETYNQLLLSNITKDKALCDAHEAQQKAKDIEMNATFWAELAHERAMESELAATDTQKKNLS